MVELMLLAGFLLLLSVAGAIADYICPHIKPLNDWIDTLPMMQSVDAEYEEREEKPTEKDALAG